MATWTGKTKGGILGYRIFILTLKIFGQTGAYLLLRFVCLYFYLFLPQATKQIYNYFRKRIGLSGWKSLINVYRNFYIFGQTLVDRAILMTGVKNNFTFEFKNEELLREFVNKKQGAILVSGHVGNWEIAGQLLERLNGKINLVMMEAEHRKIKQYLDSIFVKKLPPVIPLSDDMSHVQKIKEVLNKGELVAMHADRFIPGNQSYYTEFLGSKAAFPTGPFHFAAKFNVPVIFVYAIKQTKKHYHFEAYEPIYVAYPGSIKARKDEINKAVAQYAAYFEEVVLKYPLQWFNYYNFWQ